MQDADLWCLVFFVHFFVTRVRKLHLNVFQKVLVNKIIRASRQLDLESHKVTWWVSPNSPIQVEDIVCRKSVLDNYCGENGRGGVFGNDKRQKSEMKDDKLYSTSAQVWFTWLVVRSIMGWERVGSKGRGASAGNTYLARNENKLSMDIIIRGTGVSKVSRYHLAELALYKIIIVNRSIDIIVPAPAARPWDSFFLFVSLFFYSVSSSGLLNWQKNR